MNPTRQGLASIMVLAFVGIAGLLVVGEALLHHARLHELGLRQQRIQAREYALGAGCLPPGTVRRFDGWTVEHESNGRCSARNALGGWTVGRDGREGPLHRPPTDRPAESGP